MPVGTGRRGRVVPGPQTGCGARPRDLVRARKAQRHPVIGPVTAADAGNVPRIAAAQPSLPREVYVLSVVGGCVMLGLGLVLPVLPVYAATFGAGPTQI